jgi:hypothetical protein
MLTASSRVKEHVAGTRPGGAASASSPLRTSLQAAWRAVVAVSAGVLLAGSLLAIGAPSWLSFCLGVAAAVRIAVSAAGTAAVWRR